MRIFRFWVAAITAAVRPVYFWPAVIGALGSIAGGLIGARSQRKANRTNIQLAREQQAFAEEQANTAAQRRVADLRAAGLNPMLAYNDVADVASYDRAESEPVTAFGEGVSNASQAAFQAQAQAVAVKQGIASARLTTAQAKEAEARLPTSAKRADLELERLKTEFDKLKYEMDSAKNKRDLEERNWIELSDLALRYEEAITRAAELGLDEAKASSEFWKDVGDAPKWIKMIMEILGPASSLVKGFMPGSRNPVRRSR